MRKRLHHLTISTISRKNKVHAAYILTRAGRRLFAERVLSVRQIRQNSRHSGYITPANATAMNSDLSAASLMNSLMEMRP